MGMTPVRSRFRGSGEGNEPSAEATEIGPPPLEALVEHREAGSVQRLVTPTRAAGPDDPLLGQVVGEVFRIVRQIGEGGMARIYEATHLRLGDRRFAIKVLKAELAQNSEMTSRFLREAQSTTSIRHEGIVDVLDVHQLPDGRPYLVTEYLDGEDLGDRVGKRGPLEPKVAANIAIQLCRALAAAHARGIVHRDLKPPNVFLLGRALDALATPKVKLLDFGISKTLGNASELTKTGMIIGTPSYMSPEQARGSIVDPRSDVFALGACLYFMTTARRPFESEDTTAMLTMLVRKDPVSPRKYEPKIPSALEDIILRAMSKQPEERYTTMALFEQALTRFLDEAAKTQAAAARGSKANRRSIVLHSVVLGTWAVAASVAALAGIVRTAHDGDITLAESFLLGVGCLSAAATPIVLYVGQLKKIVWPSSTRTARLAISLEKAVAVVLMTYGGLAIAARVFFTVLWRTSSGISSGLWDIALFVLTVSAIVASGSVRAVAEVLRRRRTE
jgi:serine/threonine-protein kinase